jgi:hypothetical protein
MTPRTKEVATTAMTVNFMVVSFFSVPLDAKVSSDHHEERKGTSPKLEY